MGKLSGLCMLLAALSGAVAGDKVTEAYFLDGGALTLNVRPSYSEPIINILWKFNGDLLAEWVLDKVPLELYGSFKGRADLDTGNARLVVRGMTKADTGAYTVEINSKVHAESYGARWIKKLDKLNKPVVVIRPLACGVDSERCTASCEADTREAEPVTYSWKMGEKEWKVSKKDMEINKTENDKDDTITCRISNPVSEQDSESINNPLNHHKLNVIGAVVGSLFGVSGVVGLCVGVFMWKRKMGPFKNQNPKRTDPTTTPPPGGPSHTSSEVLRLNDKPSNSETA